MINSNSLALIIFNLILNCISFPILLLEFDRSLLIEQFTDELQSVWSYGVVVIT